MFSYLIAGLLLMGFVGVVMALSIGLKSYEEPHDMWPFR